MNNMFYYVLRRKIRQGRGIVSLGRQAMAWAGLGWGEVTFESRLRGGGAARHEAI